MEPSAGGGLAGRRVLLGVTGGIAAYKAVVLARLLLKAGAEVQVVMTAAATRFVGPDTFTALTGRKARTDVFEEPERVLHVRLAHEADVAVVAPATANVIARLAHGIADDALTCIALALNSQARLLIAPAMNGKMWQHPATQQNVTLLKSRGAQFTGPDAGMLSCGYEGVGRLEVVEQIAKRALELLAKS